VFDRLNKVGGMLIEGIGEILNRHSVPHFVNGTPAMFGITFMDKQARDWRELHDADWDLYETIVAYMIEHGVMPDPDGFEPFFLCADHTEEDAAETLQVFEDGLKYALSQR
jgi:glutamate-1-semialdehyde 2,1-aminomutase